MLLTWTVNCEQKIYFHFIQLKYIYFLQNRKLHCNKQLRYQCFQYESNPPVYFFYNIIPIKPQSRLNFYTTPVSDVAHHSYYTPFSSKSFTTSPPLPLPTNTSIFRKIECWYSHKEGGGGSGYNVTYCMTYFYVAGR